MLAKLIIITITVEAILSQNKSMASCVNVACPKWVKLNTAPVCFGAQGNQYGRFTINRNIFVSQFMFVHRTGTVTCNKSQYSYWACSPTSSGLAAVLTDDQNRILAPDASKVNSKTGWYTLPGYIASSSILVFCAPKKPHCVYANSELRLWYGEDLRGYTESDNRGKSCADVYGLLA